MRARARIGLGLALGAGCALAAALWGWSGFRTSGLPQRAGHARLAGLEAPVAVRFDRFGVPHVAAASALDAAAAIGWLHANDRMTQLELGRRAARGTLAELAGAVALGVDQMAWELGLADLAHAQWEASGDESRARLEAYARGVNAWLAQRGADLPPGLRLLRFRRGPPEPWTPIDSLCFGALMTRDLSLMVKVEQDRLRTLAQLGPEALRTLFAEGRDWPIAPAAQALASEWREQHADWLEEIEAFLADEAGGERDGSNAWVVDGSRTRDGGALLANDPHLALQLPSPWYQVQVRAPGWQAAGVTLVGLPEVVIGQGPALAWGFTNAGLDQSDLLHELVEGDAVRRSGGLEALAIERRMAPVRSGAPAEQLRRRSEHGPLLGGASLLWAAYEPFDATALFRELARARSLDDVRAAGAGFVAPAQNLLAATADGAILHTVVGAAPRRKQHSGWLPVPAAGGENGWRGFDVGVERWWRSAPDDGVLTSANDDWRAPEARDEHLGEFDVPHRARHAHRTLVARADWTPEAFADLQRDTRSLFALEVVAQVASRWRADDPDADAPAEADAPEPDERALRALELLLAWDGTMESDSAAAALYVRLEKRLGNLIFGDTAFARWLALGFGYHRRARLAAALDGRLDPSWWRLDAALPRGSGHPLEGTREASDAAVARAVVELALAEAWSDAERAFGPDPSAWRYEHRLHLHHPLSALPLVGHLWSRGPWDVPGSATTLNAFAGSPVRHGPSLRWIADPRTPDRSRIALLGGQSGHPFDPHYDDQLADYLAGRTRAIAWSATAIEAATVATLELRP